MNILEQIVANTRQEVIHRAERYPVKLLEESQFFHGPTVSLRSYLLRPDKQGIIAEIKRQSPSKGIINKHISVDRLSVGYMQAGASAISVLTDKKFFGGSGADLKTARTFNYCPILRKDFIVDEYQVIEARAWGADAILLIAAVLTPGEIKKLACLAQSLGLEVLLEIPSEQELNGNLIEEISCIGVNNRDLKSFVVSLDRSFELASKIPDSYVRVAESGIRTPADVVALRRAGFNGFLIGELFMSHSRPEEACARFIRELGVVRELGAASDQQPAC